MTPAHRSVEGGGFRAHGSSVIRNTVIARASAAARLADMTIRIRDMRGDYQRFRPRSTLRASGLSFAITSIRS